MKLDVEGVSVKIVDTFHIKSDSNNGHITWRHKHVCFCLHPECNLWYFLEQHFLYQIYQEQARKRTHTVTDWIHFLLLDYLENHKTDKEYYPILTVIGMNWQSSVNSPVSEFMKVGLAVLKFVEMYRQTQTGREMDRQSSFSRQSVGMHIHLKKWYFFMPNKWLLQFSG